MDLINTLIKIPASLGNLERMIIDEKIKRLGYTIRRLRQEQIHFRDDYNFIFPDDYEFAYGVSDEHIDVDAKVGRIYNELPWHLFIKEDGFWCVDKANNRILYWVDLIDQRFLWWHDEKLNVVGTRLGSFLGGKDVAGLEEITQRSLLPLLKKNGFVVTNHLGNPLPIAGTPAKPKEPLIEKMLIGILNGEDYRTGENNKAWFSAERKSFMVGRKQVDIATLLECKPVSWVDKIPPEGILCWLSPGKKQAGFVYGYEMDETGVVRYETDSGWCYKPHPVEGDDHRFIYGEKK